MQTRTFADYLASLSPVTPAEDLPVLALKAGAARVTALDTYATQDEVDALVISGGGLAVASEAQGLAGTNNTTGMSPLRVQEKLDQRSRFLIPSGDVTGATDDANIAAAKAVLATGDVHRIHFGPGRFYITDTIDFTDDDELYAITVTGDGHGGALVDTNPHGTQIVMLTDNVPIMKVRGQVTVGGLSLIYNTQQTTADTASIGLSINNVSMASITEVAVWNSHIGFGIPQADFGASGFNAVWASNLSNLKSVRASHTHFDLRNYSGGGTNCQIGPLYIAGGGTLDFVTPGQSCEYAIRGVDWGGYELGAVTIEGQIINERGLDLAGSCVLTIGTIRFEAVDWKKNNDGLLYLGGSTNACQIGSVEVRNTKWTPASPTAGYIVRSAAPTNVLGIGAVIVYSDCDFGAGVTRRALLNGASSADSDVRVGPIIDTGSELSDLLWSESVSPDSQSPVRVWRGRDISRVRQAGRTTTNFREITATAAPASGTWAVGDRAWNPLPSAGGFIGWVCTSAGTPGTWKTFGAVSP